MTNYVPISYALRRIPRSIFKETDDSTLLSSMLNALRDLPSIARTESKIDIFEIIDGKVNIPKEVKYINLVTYLSSKPNDNDIDSFTSCVENPEAEEDFYNTNNICKYTINYKLFLDSSYYNKNFTPMKYVGSTTSILHNQSPNRFVSKCIHTFTVDKNKCMHTSVTDGYVAIDYDIELKDENGDFLIPDYPSIMSYLAKYALMEHWEDRQSSKEEQASQLYQRYQREAELERMKAKGEILLRNLDLNTIHNVVNNTYGKFIKIPESFIYAR